MNNIIQDINEIEDITNCIKEIDKELDSDIHNIDNLRRINKKAKKSL